MSFSLRAALSYLQARIGLKRQDAVLDGAQVRQEQAEWALQAVEMGLRTSKADSLAFPAPASGATKASLSDRTAQLVTEGRVAEALKALVADRGITVWAAGDVIRAWKSQNVGGRT